MIIMTIIHDDHGLNHDDDHGPHGGSRIPLGLQSYFTCMNKLPANACSVPYPPARNKPPFHSQAPFWHIQFMHTDYDHHNDEYGMMSIKQHYLLVQHQIYGRRSHQKHYIRLLE